MNFFYTPRKVTQIVQHEGDMLEKYQRKINKYSKRFSLYGCSLCVGLVWINLKTNERSYLRLPFQDGYSCYVYCDIEKNGKLLRHYETNGEADYYELSCIWNVSSISNLFFRRHVSLFTIACDIDDELETNLNYIVHSSTGDGFA